jgi:hypothetical protein
MKRSPGSPSKGRLELGLSKALGVVYRPTACMTTVPPVGATLTKGDALFPRLAEDA